MEVKSMSNDELIEYVGNIYDACVEFIKRNDYYKYWRAVYTAEYDDVQSAVRIASAILTGQHEYIMQTIEDVFDEVAMETAGISEEEYYEHPETPFWQREDWKYNEEIEEWEPIE